jgi:hypothetical protein
MRRQEAVAMLGDLLEGMKEYREARDRNQSVILAAG